MAKGVAVPLATALAVAERIVARLRPWCEQIEIAGSIRRGRPEVHDIDLVVRPRPRDLVKLLEAAKATTQVTLRVAEKTWKFLATGARLPATDITVDVYLTTPETWPTILFVRTGSKAHNIWIASRALSMGMRWHADGSGLEDDKGKVIPIRSEKHIFAALGLPYREPSERERP